MRVVTELVVEIEEDEERNGHVGDQDVRPVELGKGIDVLAGNHDHAEDEGEDRAKREEPRVVIELI